ELKIRIAGPRPDSVLEIEARAVGGLGEPEQREIGVGVAGNGLYLIFAAAGNDFEDDALPPQVRSTEPVDTSDLAIERGVARLNVWIPDEIRELVATGREGEIRRTAGGR